jgi:putative MATE family efflux protein
MRKGTAAETIGEAKRLHRESAVHQDWIKGSIFNNLLLLSWPIAITQTLQMLGPTIDMVWVGKLGDSAIAAVGLSGTVVQLGMAAMMGLTQGMRAVIARYIGAKDTESASRVAQQAVVVTAGVAIVIALIGAFLSEQIMTLVHPSRDVITLGAIYLRINFIGSAAMSFRMMMDAIMQASGDSMNPMRIAIVFRLFHIALCPFLIFGWWIFPEMGVSGAATTAVISQSLGVVLGLGVLFGERSRIKLSFKGFHFDPGIIWRIVRIGLPALISGIQQNLNQFILQIFIAPFGTIALAAHTINLRLAMFLFTFAMAFGMGAGVLVGQNLGAREPQRAEKSAWLAVGLVEVLVVFVSLLMFIWTAPIIRIFNTEPALVKMAGEFLRIALVGYTMLGFNQVLMSALQGAGDTIPVMVISMVTVWVITIPLAYYFHLQADWGIYGIRWTMAASTIVGGVANLVYFRVGKWKTRRV